MSHVILGGGISGLAAAFYLSKAGKNGIKLYESSQRVGGWINSVKMTNGTVFEVGPRTLRCDGMTSENTLALSEEIGLGPSIVPVEATNPVARKRMIYINDRLVYLPNSFLSLFRINPPYMKPLIHAFWKDIRTPKKELDDDNIYDFLARRFGEGYAEFPGSAMACGVFAGDAKEISVKTVFKNLFSLEQKYGSVIRGALKGTKKRPEYRSETTKWCAWSFQGGLESLPIQLKEYLEKNKKAEIHLGSACSNIGFENGKAKLTINGKEEIANHVYCSLPSRDVARLLGRQHSFLRNELSSIPFVSVAVVNLEYDGNLIQDKSFGFLIPPNQNLPVLGVTFDSCIFPEKEKTILTVMMGGKWFEKHFGPNPEEKFLLQIAQEHIKKILKIDKDPTNSLVTILRNCLPQYIVGHTRRIDSIREYITQKQLPLTLIGNSYDGVGIHDSIMSAKENVKSALAKS